jgi:hypothetical protein
VVDTAVVDVVAVAVVIAKPARCIPLSVQTVAVKRKCLSSHEMTGLSIATIVTSRKALAVHTIAVQTTVDRAGNHYG